MGRTALAQSPELAAQGGRRSWVGWPLALTATVSFSIAPPVTKGAILAGVQPATLLLARMILSLLLLGGYLVFFDPEHLRIDRKGLLVAVVTGMVNGMGFLSFFQALTRLESSIASMIFMVNPLIVLMMLASRGEKLTRRHGLRLLLGIGGVYLLVGPSGKVDLRGALLVLVAAFTFATQLVSIQWYLKTYQPWTITFYMVLGMSLVGLGWWLGSGGTWVIQGRTGWTAVIVLALISTFVARLAMFGGVRFLGSGQIAMTVPLETLLSVSWALLFLHERLNPWQWLGGALILASMILAIQRLRLRRRRLRWRAWSRL
jgi:drug/metabolite transporter (DMT)-like permease